MFLHSMSRLMNQENFSHLFSDPIIKILQFPGFVVSGKKCLWSERIALKAVDARAVFFTTRSPPPNIPAVLSAAEAILSFTMRTIKQLRSPQLVPSSVLCAYTFSVNLRLMANPMPRTC